MLNPGRTECPSIKGGVFSDECCMGKGRIEIELLKKDGANIAIFFGESFFLGKNPKRRKTFLSVQNMFYRSTDCKAQGLCREATVCYGNELSNCDRPNTSSLPP